MISVRNLRLRLSGNRASLLLFLTLLFFSSCDLFRKVPKDPGQNTDQEELDVIEGRRVYNSETGKWEYETVITEPMDTVEWTITPEEERPPISSEETDRVREELEESEERKFDFKLAFLLPFLTNRFDPLADEIDPRSELFLHFYEGAKLALDTLNDLDIKMEVYAFDTKASPREVVSLLQRPEMEEMDVLIGPYRSNNIELAARFAQVNEKVIISPFSPEENLTANNPHFIQITPSLRSHSRAIMNHVHQNHPQKKIVLVVRDKPEEVQRLPMFQEANILAAGSSMVDSLQEFVVPEDEEDFREKELTGFITEGDTTIFVLPSWSNESFIYSFLRRLNIDRLDNPVVVYGMPQWRKFNLISYDYYEELNVHISASRFIDRKDEQVKQFQRRFYEKYGAIPLEEAFLGYDVALFIGKMLDRYGLRFTETLDQEVGEYLHNNFHFERVAPSDPDVEIDPDRFEYYENRHVNMLRFKGYQFQK
jgi:ABC-type branched-subunit amino acid transport system substrate-binding protein